MKSLKLFNGLGLVWYLALTVGYELFVLGLILGMCFYEPKTVVSFVLGHTKKFLIKIIKYY